MQKQQWTCQRMFLALSYLNCQTVQPTAFNPVTCIVKCFIKFELFRPLHANILKHLLHVVVLGSAFLVNKSKTLGYLAQGI